MSNENPVKHQTSPVQIDNDPSGVYIASHDAEMWSIALRLALDPYKAPEAREPAIASLKVLQRLMTDAVAGVNVREIETKETP